MPFFGKRFDDLFDCGQKAHVQHAIGFVEHELFDVAQVDMALVHQVNQAARSRDHDFGATCNRANLACLVDAAVNVHVPHFGVLAVNLEAVRDLNRQFTCRCQD